MHTRHVGGVTIRPLRNGDTDTAAALVARLGEESHERRFGGARPRLSERELTELARVDGTRHVLVAHLGTDPLPAGIARLVRDGRSAKIACAVAEAGRGRGVGRALLEELAALARAAGITELRATVSGDDPRAVWPATRLARVRETRRTRGERGVVLALF